MSFARELLPGILLWLQGVQMFKYELFAVMLASPIHVQYSRIWGQAILG